MAARGIPGDRGRGGSSRAGGGDPGALPLVHPCIIQGTADSWLCLAARGEEWADGHVGSVDAPVAPGDVQQIALEFRRAVGTGSDAPATNGVDVLGWDFAFEMNEVRRQQAQAA